MVGNLWEEYIASVFGAEIISYIFLAEYSMKPNRARWLMAMHLAPIREVFQVQILVWTSNVLKGFVLFLSPYRQMPEHYLT